VILAILEVVRFGKGATVEGSNFKRLTKQEQSAVASYVKWDFDKLILLQPGTTVSMNALSDPEGGQDRLREVIAGDRRRLAAIMRASSDATDVNHKGFTLIELSIVLVIIGLIVGGVLAGKDLIRAAGVRATITQIERYNTAANTFRGKYGYLPGDIRDPDASSFGFAPRGQYAGEGDGNGTIEGVSTNYPGHNFGNCEMAGETAMFWVDLSAVHLIDGSFTAASPVVIPSGNITTTSTPSIDAYFPAAKAGENNYIYVWSDPIKLSGANAFGFSGVSLVNTSSSCGLTSTPSLTVKEAYSVDSKIDDGLPQQGRVTAEYLTTGSGSWNPWAAGGGNFGASSFSPNYGPTTAATPGSSTTCYDNGGNAGQAQQYSVEISDGSNINCALSFKIQAGD